MTHPTVQHYFFNVDSTYVPRRDTLFYTQRSGSTLTPRPAEILFGVQRAPEVYPQPVCDTLFTVNAIYGNNNNNNNDTYSPPVYTIPTGYQENKQQPYPVFLFPSTAENARNLNKLQNNAFTTALNIYGSRLLGAPPIQIDVDSSIDAILSENYDCYNLGQRSAQLLNNTNYNSNNLINEIINLRRLYDTIQNSINRYFNSIPR